MGFSCWKIHDLSLNSFFANSRSSSNINFANPLKSVSAVHPSARFGELHLDGERVVTFQEKPQLQTGWINGGFFVLEPDFIKYIPTDDVMLERQPLEKATHEQELYAYKHEGFWQCMDTRRDHHLLETLWNEGNAPWKK